MTSMVNLIVPTRSGKLAGSLEKGVYSFRGIPFAAPPVGAGRWLPPQPVEPWTGVRPAHAFGMVAPQLVMRWPGAPVIPGFNEEPEPQSEDCLFLNVYTPGLDDAHRPVMVWIHGGAFAIGAASFP